MKLRLGTRGSKLALAQSRLVADKLMEARSDLDIELTIISTTGDRLQGVELFDGGVDRGTAESGVTEGGHTSRVCPLFDKGLWVKEIEEELVKGRIDFAVHSGKDVPVAISEQTTILPVLRRECPEDVLILHPSLSYMQSVEELPTGVCVGTNSLRRRAQLLNIRKDIVVKSLRGNVNTRLEKLHQEGEYQAIVLARASLTRLAVNDVHARPLSKASFVPAVNQGILVMQTLANAHGLMAILEPLVDRQGLEPFLVEREIIRLLGADCHSALGVYAERRSNDGNVIDVVVRVYERDGVFYLEEKAEFEISEWQEETKQIASKLISRGADTLLLG